MRENVFDVVNRGADVEEHGAFSEAESVPPRISAIFSFDPIKLRLDHARVS